ncbi:phage Gp37/Gp68 family protein [Thermoclostridium stercorarium]|nr:phage Gp37/Gp68 family protein [Thermoclostridium stercorarium]
MAVCAYSLVWYGLGRGVEWFSQKFQKWRRKIWPKQNERGVKMNEKTTGKSTYPKNIWLGVTAENQQRADERIPILLQIPAAVRFVSVEPMLGPVDIYRWLRCHICSNNGSYYNPNDEVEECPICSSEDPSLLDWVICGGETGPGARPVHPDWVRSLRDQCQDAGVPFFFKSWGEWGRRGETGITLNDGPFGCWDNDEFRPGAISSHGEHMVRVGKKKAGRILDGRTWYEMPEIKL